MPDQLSEEDKPLVRKVDGDKIEETKPVVWTPEDASRFLTSAIHESQRPLADALKQRPVTSKALAVMLTIIVVAAAVIGFILWNQMEKAEKRADSSQSQRDQALIERHQQEAKAVTLLDKLEDAQLKHTALNQRVDSLQGSEEALRRAQSDMAKYRRQAELLKNQIAGLEMEKAAIQRQMDAVRAMVIDHQNEGEVPEEPENPFEAAPAQPEAAAAAEPAGQAKSLPLPLPVETGTAEAPEPVQTPEPLQTGESVKNTEPPATEVHPEAAAEAEQPQARTAPVEAEAIDTTEPEAVSKAKADAEAVQAAQPEATAVTQDNPPQKTAPPSEPSRPILSPEKFLAENEATPEKKPAVVVMPVEDKPAEVKTAPLITEENKTVGNEPAEVKPIEEQAARSTAADDMPRPKAMPITETAPDYHDEEDNGPIKSTPIRLEDMPQLQVEAVAQTRDDAALTQQESAFIGNAVAASHAAASGHDASENAADAAGHDSPEPHPDDDVSIDRAVEEIRAAVEDIKRHGDPLEAAAITSGAVTAADGPAAGAGGGAAGISGPAAIGALKRDLDRKGQ